MQKIAAAASVGTGRWHEGAGSSGVYGTQVVGGGGSSVVGGFESDTDRARRERMEKEQIRQQQQAQRASDVAQLAASMKENEDADLSDNPEVVETMMADMSSNWEVPTPEEVENMQIDPSEIPEDMMDDVEDDAADDGQKSTGTVTGEWAVGQDHRNKQANNPQAAAAATGPSSSSPAASSDKPKSQGTITGEWAVGADHKMKQSRRPSTEGRGFES